MRISDWSSTCALPISSVRPQSMNHEEAFVHSFIVKEKQSRYLLKLSSQKHRRDFLSRLHGGHLDYDSQFAEQLPGNYTSTRSEEHTYELKSLMRNSYAVFCLKKTTAH